jgi:hypothetical protein
MNPAPVGRRRISFLSQLLLGAAVAGGCYFVLTLPPRAARLTPGADGRVVYGAFHVHTNRSDGTGTPDEIAAAAGRAGLTFVVLTDHGDATRDIDPPQYRNGVLSIDAAEISSAGGHIVALGLQRQSLYPLAGEARDVIDDIHRLGGWTVAAHPDSPKVDLRWRGAGNGVDYDGLEWLNLDSEWRDEKPSRLLGAFIRYFLRGPETITSLIQRPVPTFRRWDMATRGGRPVVGLAALDAHARLPWRASAEDTRNRTLAALPTYRQTLRTVSQAVVLDRPLTGNAADDSAAVLAALRQGRTYSVVTAFAAPGSLVFEGRQQDAVVRMGESLNPADANVSFTAEVNDPAARVVLLHNSGEVASGRGKLSFAGAAAPGAYRVEAYRPGSTVPWIVSNPIYRPGGGGGGRGGFGGPASPPPALRFVSLPGTANWGIEKSPTSSSTFAQDGTATRFDFGLGPGVAFDQFSALAATITPELAQEGFDRVRFTVRANQPMRFSVQLRLPSGRRWRHSVYADTTPQTVELHVQDFQPADSPSTTTRPIVARLQSVLVVVDTLNAFPGTKGTIWLSDVALGVGNTQR